MKFLLRLDRHLICRSCVNTNNKSNTIRLSPKPRLSHFVIKRHLTNLYDPSDPRLKFVNVESHGAVYNVGYLSDGPPGGSTVVAIHGAPGGGADFYAISADLVKNGVRVVAPNLPGNGVTKLEKGSSYNHSTKHRTDFIANFLSALNINSVDVVLGHSVGGPVAIQLAANLPEVRGLALFSSVGYEIHVGAQPYPLIRLYSCCLTVPGLGSVLRKILTDLYYKKGFRVDDPDHLESALKVVVGITFNQVKKDAEKVRLKGLPVYTIMCLNDRIVNWECTMSVTRVAAGHDEKSVSYFDENLNLTKGPSLDDKVPSRTLIFAKGGHFPYKPHGESNHMILKGLMDLLEHVQQRKHNS